ncbi:MAG: hypothetical protein WC572_04720 [Candidatus Omnitrophota bacterium]
MKAYKIIALFLCFILLLEQSGFAQAAGLADISPSLNSNISGGRRSAAPDISRLRYIYYDKREQSFRVILDGQAREVSGIELSKEPLKFFYTGISIPNDRFWVNLRPDSSRQIISDNLLQTDLGKIFLEADLELKKDLARSTFPSTEEGKEYWEKIYNKIEELYGRENPQVYINTRIWITPGEVIICEDQNSAYIYKACLNVSTESTYLKNRMEYGRGQDRSRVINEYSSELIKKIILPKILKEVNTSEKYARLRQVYYSLILAQWFKRKFYGAGGLYPYLIDRNNLAGLDSDGSWSKETYFKEYQRSFKEKEYDLKVNVFNLSGRSVRTYSNGGVDLTGIFAGANPARVEVISTDSLLPPATSAAGNFEVNNTGSSLGDPYFAGEIFPVAADKVSGPGREALRTISEDEIERLMRVLQSSPKKYIQKLCASKRIDLRKRIRFIAERLGFDILRGEGSSLLARRPETLAKNKEFLEGRGIAVNVSNLRSSRRYLAASKIRKVSADPVWKILSERERLGVVSCICDVYGLSSSRMEKDENWKKLLEWFGLRDCRIEYSSRAAGLAQRNNLLAPEKAGNFGYEQNMPAGALKKPVTLPSAPAARTEKEEMFSSGDDLLRELETAIDADLNDVQIIEVLNTLADNLPGNSSYERARQILRHIHPDEFKKVKEAATHKEPFASNALLRSRIDAISLERPSDLSVGLVRSMSKIHDWEKVLGAEGSLSPEGLEEIVTCCERIVDVLPLRLTQETSDSIGSIYKIIKKVHVLIEKTIRILTEQQAAGKAGYKENAAMLIARGHYFSDYFGALSYLSAMNIPKGYVFNFENVNGNGKAAKKVKYSWWQRITAVRAMEKNAVSNLKRLLPLLNTEGNEFSPEEHYILLKPTRLGPSDSWLLRKPVSVLLSLMLGFISVTTLFMSGSFSILSLFSSSIGFLTIPFLHFSFAIIGWISTKRDINKFHQRIRVLEKKWQASLSAAGHTRSVAQAQEAGKVFTAEDLPEDEPLEEDLPSAATSLSRQDLEGLARTASALGIRPVSLPGTAGLVFVIMPEALMLTGDSSRICFPVRLGNRIFVGDDYFSEHSDDPAALLPVAAYEEGDENAPYDISRGNAGGAVHPAKNARRLSPGGIDFRSFNFTTVNMPVGGIGTRPIKRRGADVSCLEKEIRQIDRLLKAKIIPSGERLKECIESIPGSQRKSYAVRMNSLLAEVFMLQEGYAQASDSAYVELLKEIISN